MMLEAGDAGIYFMAPDSFKSYAVGAVIWENTIVVVDEFSGVRKEILQKAELSQFLDEIDRCSSLIVADAFLSQIDIRVIQQHREGTMQIVTYPGFPPTRRSLQSNRARASESLAPRFIGSATRRLHEISFTSA
jgi:hypothetical protein